MDPHKASLSERMQRQMCTQPPKKQIVRLELFAKLAEKTVKIFIIFSFTIQHVFPFRNTLDVAGADGYFPRPRPLSMSSGESIKPNIKGHIAQRVHNYVNVCLAELLPLPLLQHVLVSRAASTAFARCIVGSFPLFSCS